VRRAAASEIAGGEVLRAVAFDAATGAGDLLMRDLRCPFGRPRPAYLASCYTIFGGGSSYVSRSSHGLCMGMAGAN
jgi:hypothetical protein